MIVPLHGCLLFFDLAGTLMSRGGRLSAHQSQILVDVGQRAERVVLVSGQSGDDPQVHLLMDKLGAHSGVDFVAYTTGGIRRWVRTAGAYNTDDSYLPEARMDTAESDALIGRIETLLDAAKISCLQLPRFVDECAVRTHVDPDLVERTVGALRSGLVDYAVISEGRTSVFVMRQGFGKRRAVEHELAMAKNGVTALYFGNELADGNDREVLDVPSLRARAVGACGAPVAAHCVSLGDSVADLYEVLNRSLAKCAVLCISLGGTNVQLAALSPYDDCAAEPEIHWRQAIPDVRESGAFANWLADLIDGFLKRRNLDWRDLGVVGVPFPGPERDGRWYSNNLTADFQHGSQFQKLLEQSIHTRAIEAAPTVRILFDAKCDAGGELYHPLGRLRGHFEEATVLNLATGIAAAFISRGRVLTSTNDFSKAIHPSFDAGMGQLGRHLWWDHDTAKWEYHAAPGGATPKLSGTKSRLTDRLGGPALAARLLCTAVRTDTVLELSTAFTIHPQLQDLADDLTQRSIADAAAVMRRLPSALTRALVQWVDDAYLGHGTSGAVNCANQFVRSTIDDLAGAIGAWQCAHYDGAQPWMRFAKRIVITGGIGIHFIAGSNGIAGRDLCQRLVARLDGISVERSALVNGAERESFIFLHQAY